MALDPTQIASDPLPYLRGLSRLVPEQRLAAVLSRRGRHTAVDHRPLTGPDRLT
jgi:hypothetical protein